MPSKRINQLSQSYKIADGDLLVVDMQGMTESRKVTKGDFLQEYVKDAPREVATEDWYWARKNGQWYRIHPDEYVFEAPFDGGIYVRVNGNWEKVTGVSGDMLQSIYDSRARSEDIFNFVVDSLEQLNRSSSYLLDSRTALSDSKIEKIFSIRGSLISVVLNGETIEIPLNGEDVKSYENPSILQGIDNFVFISSGRNLYQNQKLIKGGYNTPEAIDTIHTFDPIFVSPGDVFTFYNNSEISLNLIKTDKYNNFIEVLYKDFIIGNSYTIPKGTEYIGLEIKHYELIDTEPEFKTIKEPYENYTNFIVCSDGQYKMQEVVLNKPIYGLNNLVDSLDFNSGEIVYTIKKNELNELNNWSVTDLIRGETIAIKATIKEGDPWLDPLTSDYGIANVFENYSYSELSSSDNEGIAFFEGGIYVRILSSRFTPTLSTTNENILMDFVQFIQDNPIEVLHQSLEVILNDTIEPIPLISFDDVTNLTTFTNIDYNGETLLEYVNIFAEFDSVLDHVIKKDGDWMDGTLGVGGGIRTPHITGVDTGNNEGPLLLNPTNNQDVFIGDNHKVLDKRDFSVDETIGRADEWSPEVATILEKEANDNRIPNTAYLKRDYAPLDSAPLVGVPTAPKANEINTAQIATGEFVNEFYHSKTTSDERYILSTDGIAKGIFVLEETIPGSEENTKRIPNIEFLKNQYHNKEYSDSVFAPLDSPNLTGTPKTITPDGSTPEQIVNVRWANDNYVNSSGDIMRGEFNLQDLTTSEGTIGGKLTVQEGAIEMPKRDAIQTSSNLFVLNSENVDHSLDEDKYTIIFDQITGKITVNILDTITNEHIETLGTSLSLTGNGFKYFFQINSISSNISIIAKDDLSNILATLNSETKYEIVTLTENKNYTITFEIIIDNNTTSFELEPYISDYEEGQVLPVDFEPYFIPDNVGTLNNNNKVLITDNASKIITSNITSTELQSLHKIRSNIQDQLDNIPKYFYKSGLNINITADDFPIQSELDALLVEAAREVYPEPELWWAVTTTFVLLPSDVKKEQLYYFNPENASGENPGWTYLYNLTTAIQLANGDLAGIIQASSNGDIEIIDGDPVVKHAEVAERALNAEHVEWNTIQNRPSALPQLAINSSLEDLDLLIGDEFAGSLFRFADTVVHKPIPKFETEEEIGTCTIELIKTSTGYLQLYYNDVTYSVYKRFYNSTLSIFSEWEEYGGGGSVRTVNTILPDSLGDIKIDVELTQEQYNALETSGEINPNLTYFIKDSSDSSKYLATNEFATIEPENFKVDYSVYADKANNGNPPGSIIMFAGINAPEGYLFCNGQEVSRNNYLKLFEAIGILYGQGNGVDTFNLPNFNNKFPLGVADDGVGFTAGSETVTLTTAQIPAHYHALPIFVSGTGGSKAGGVSVYSATCTNSSSGQYNAGPSGGTGGSHNNMPPYITTKYIIKF